MQSIRPEAEALGFACPRPSEMRADCARLRIEPHTHKETGTRTRTRARSAAQPDLSQVLVVALLHLELTSVAAEASENGFWVVFGTDFGLSVAF